jgi:peptidylprolyl isomerase
LKGQKPFSYEAGKGKVIRGWDDGVMAMTVGEVAGEKKKKKKV